MKRTSGGFLFCFRGAALLSLGAAALSTQPAAALENWRVTQPSNVAGKAWASWGESVVGWHGAPINADEKRAVRLTTWLQKTSVAQWRWKAGGKEFSRRFLLNGGSEWRSTTLNLTRAEGWSGSVSDVSLLLKNDARNQNRIAAIEFLNNSNLLPAANLSDAPLWKNAGNKYRTRLYSLTPNARYTLSGAATLSLFDADGNAIGKPLLSTQGKSATFLVPWNAASAVIEAASLQSAEAATLVQQSPAALESTPGIGEVPRAQWIWYPEIPTAGTRLFRREFDLKSVPQSAHLVFSADDRCIVVLNGVEIGRNSSFKTMSTQEVTRHLRAGKNRLEIRVTNGGGPGGLLAELWMKNGAQNQLIASDAQWKTVRLDEENAAAPPSGWVSAQQLGQVPTMPWRRVNYDYRGPRDAAKIGAPNLRLDSNKRVLHYQFNLSGAATRGAWLRVLRGERILAERDLGALSPQGKNYRGELSLAFVGVGAADVVLDAPYTTLSQKKLQTIQIAAAPLRPFPSTQLVQTPRGPVLNIDGFRSPTHMYVSVPAYRDDPNGYRHYLRDAAQMGLHLQSFDVPGVGYDGNNITWPGPGQYDFSRLDEICQTALAVDAQARLVLRVGLDAPNWWVAAHPDELNRREDGTRDGLHPVWSRQSIGSQIWQRDTRDYLAALVTYLKSRPYAPRVWGLVFCTSGAIEWIAETLPTNPLDYSAANIAAWRRWLRREYSDDAALRRAWNDNAVSLDSATIPSSAKRFAAERGDFRDPTQGARPAMDYVRFVDDRILELMLDGARTIKAASDERLAVGVYYGYHVFGSSIYTYLNQAGHNNFVKALQSPDILFYAGPVGYRTRFPGQANLANSAADSAELHGKFWVQEEDFRTYLDTLPHEYNNGRNDTFFDSVHTMRRDFGQALTSGWGLWWFEMIEGWLRNPALRHEIKRFRAAHDIPADASLTPRAQVAVVLDEESVPGIEAWRGDSPQRAALHDQMDAFNRTGVPFRVLSLRDVLDGKAPDFKAYVFLDAWRVSPAESEALHARFRRSNATVLWQWGAGVFESFDAAPSAQNAARLTGFDLGGATGTEASPGATTDLTRFATLKSSAWTSGLRAEDFGHNSPQNTRFIPRDGEALGTLSDGASLAVKPQNGWTSLYLSVPNIPARLVRNIARQAGIPEYSDSEDVFTAGYGFLSLHAQTAGRKTLTLPQAADVWDALQNKRIAANVKTFSYDSAAGETRIFALRK